MLCQHLVTILRVIRECIDLGYELLLGGEHLVLHFDAERCYLFTQLLIPAGVRPERVSELQLTEAVVEAVKAGLGLSVLARWTVEPYLAAGDLLAVHKTPDASNGQIVVARIDDEVTVKRFQRTRNRAKVTLLPENADYEPIEVDLREQAFQIEGLSVGVIRQSV